MTYEEERGFLLRSIDDLDREHDAGDLDDEDYSALRDGYTARAAAVLHAIERAQQRPVRPAPARRPRRSPWSTVGLVAAVLLVAVGAGLAMARASGTRLPGQTANGNIPDSIASLLAEGNALLGSDNAAAVVRYDRVLAIDPDDVEALTYKAWAQYSMSLEKADAALVDAARSGLDRAIEVRDDYPDARVFRGVLALRADHDATTAETHFDAYYALTNPPPQLAALVHQADTDARTALGLAPREVRITGDAQIDKLLNEARTAYETDIPTALEKYVAVLALDPNNVEALTYRGWIQVQTGYQAEQQDLITSGKALLDKAIALEPTFLDALAYRGIAAWGVDKDATLAERRFDQFFALGPPAELVSLVLAADSSARESLGLPERFPASTTTSP